MVNIDVSYLRAAFSALRRSRHSDTPCLQRCKVGRSLAKVGGQHRRFQVSFLQIGALAMEMSAAKLKERKREREKERERERKTHRERKTE